MPFDRLPSGGINYPIVHPQPVPARPVIPTAQFAAQIAAQLGEVMKNLSPEERKRKQLELEFLGAKVNETNAAADYYKLQQHSARAQANRADQVRGIAHGAFDQAFGRSADLTAGPGDGTDHRIPTTSVGEQQEALPTDPETPETVEPDLLPQPPDLTNP